MKKAIIYGNCHASAIKEILKANRIFSQEYEVINIPAIQEIKDRTFFDNSNFSKCDLFIHQSIRLDNRYGCEFASENIIKMLPKGCRIIAIPNVYHMPKCFFPQYCEGQELRDTNANRTFFFRDEIVDNGLKINKTIDEIIADYENVDFFSKDELLVQYEGFMEKIVSREKDWDVKVSEFIEEEHTQRQLFFDPNHPTNYFLEFVAWKTLCLLFPEHNICFDEVRGTSKIRLDAYEMPVCASVTNAFGFIKENTEIRRTGTKIRRRKMDLKEYIIQYQAKCYLVNDFSDEFKKISKKKYRMIRFANLPYSIGFVAKKILGKIYRYLCFAGNK